MIIYICIQTLLYITIIYKILPDMLVYKILLCQLGDSSLFIQYHAEYETPVIVGGVVSQRPSLWSIYSSGVGSLQPL